MAYEPSKRAVWILEHPKASLLMVLCFGFFGGLVSQLAFGGQMFSRFGSVTVALALFSFGSVATELLARGQYSFWMGEDGEPAAPFQSFNVRKCLDFQTIAAVAGTLQWGFGDLMFDQSVRFFNNALH